MSVAQRVAARFLILRVARRVAVATATPTFDDLYKKSASVSRSVGLAAKRLAALADDVESGGPTDSLLRRQIDIAYKIIEIFRPIMNRGEQELARSGGGTKSEAEAANLLTSVKTLASAYDQVMGVVQDKNGEIAPGAAHDLAVAAATLGTVFRQFTEAYGT